MCRIDVSVIIPLFNAEKTIDKCIESVINQSIADRVEILCVDDGSSDHSVEAVEKLMGSYQQLRLLRQNHQGAGAARNRGIHEAIGKYIAFLDADDILWEEAALAYMTACSDKNHAYVCGSYRKVDENGRISDSGLLRQFDIPAEGCFLNFSDFQYDYDYQSFIFNREFLVKNEIAFPSYMRYQDPPFFLDAMIHAQRFYAVPVILYCYKISYQNGKLVERYMDQILTGILETLQKARDYGYDQLFEKIILRVERQFYESILAGLNSEIMGLLLEINELYQCECRKELDILQDIWNYGKKIGDLAKSHGLLKQILDIKQNVGGFQSFFEKRKIKKVVVYGLGVYGKILISELEECGIEIVGCMDQSVGGYKQYVAIRPGEMIPESDAIIVSPMNFESIMEELRQNITCNIYSFFDIIRDVLNV